MADLTIHSSNIDNLVIGPLNAKYSARGDRILRYYIDLRHSKMNLHKEVSAPELFILQSKVDALLAGWDEKFTSYQLHQLFRSGKDSAEEMTADAMRQQETLKRILSFTLKVHDAVDWDALKDRSEYPMPERFSEDRPQSVATPAPEYAEPKTGFLDIVLGRKRALIQQAQDRHAASLRAWEAAEGEREQAHAQAIAAWEGREAAFWAEHHGNKSAFAAQQAESHAKVDALRDQLRSGDADAVIEHASLILENSEYDGLFEKSYLLQYHRSQKLLLVAYDLAAPDTLPQTKSVKFVKATGELVETKISDRDRKANFESVAYQVCLRTIHELFEGDTDGNLERILFNGMVNFVDPSTGPRQPRLHPFRAHRA